MSRTAKQKSPLTSSTRAAARRSGSAACQPSSCSPNGCMQADVLPEPTAPTMQTPVNRPRAGIESHDGVADSTGSVGWCSSPTVSEISSLDGSNGSGGREPRLAPPIRAAGPHTVHAEIDGRGERRPGRQRGQEPPGLQQQVRAWVAQLDHVEDRHGSRRRPRRVLAVHVPGEAARHRRRSPFAPSSRPLPRFARRGPVGATGGACSCGADGKTHGSRGGVEARFAACAHGLQPRQGPVRHAVSDPVGTTGAAEAHGRRDGSDPLENGPGLHSRAFRRGRSRDFSLQEGQGGPGGPRRRPPA